MTDLRSLTLAQLEALCRELGWERYRAEQLFAWLWQKGARSFDEMTNIGKDRRGLLALRYTADIPSPDRVVEARDGTTKFTFKLSDGEAVESVFITDGDRRTVCVSTQAGCQLGCRFCYTARRGFRRNLCWYEIGLQVLAVRQHVCERPIANRQTPITNVVFMGMGEPFLNYDAVIEAIKVINHESGLGIGARHITVSTAGIPEGIKAYSLFPLQTRLAVSLNATDDETRSLVMPVNRMHPLATLMAAVREFTEAKDKRVTFEYVLLDGVNNREQDVRQLARLLKGIQCKVNLIPLNPFPGCEFKPPPPESIEAFARRLWPLLPAVTVRKSKGSDILAGCGQLAGLDPPA